MIRATGLWKQTGKDGKTYLTGIVGNVRITILPNKYQRDGKNDPDYHLMISEKERKQDTPKKKQPEDL